MARFLFEVLAAGVGTTAFALLFHVPHRYSLRCGIIGGAGWFVYLSGLPFVSAPVSIFLATVAVVFLSRFSAVQLRCPVTLFLICGIFPLVPGLGVYRTASALVAGQMALASKTGFSALQTSMVMVLAILLGLELPSGLFRRLANLIPSKK